MRFRSMLQHRPNIPYIGALARVSIIVKRVETFSSKTAIVRSSEDSKLKYAFELFRNVRNVSYVAYDLQIAKTPFTLDLWNEDAVILLFRELLSAFNNQTSAHNLVASVEKLLHDTVYNENSSAICYYKISRRMVKEFCDAADFSILDYYNDCLLNENSCFNKDYHSYTYTSIITQNPQKSNLRVLFCR